MGEVASLARIARSASPVASLADAVANSCKYFSVFVLNDCQSSCNCCGCWTFGFVTHRVDEHTSSSENSSETSSENSSKDGTLCGPMWE